MSKWGEWFQTLYFDQEKNINISGKFTKIYIRKSKQMKSKGEARPREMYTGRLDHHLHCPAIHLTMREDGLRMDTQH